MEGALGVVGISFHVGRGFPDEGAETRKSWAIPTGSVHSHSLDLERVESLGGL